MKMVNKWLIMFKEHNNSPFILKLSPYVRSPDTEESQPQLQTQGSSITPFLINCFTKSLMLFPQFFTRSPVNGTKISNSHFPFYPLLTTMDVLIFIFFSDSFLFPPLHPLPQRSFPTISSNTSITWVLVIKDLWSLCFQESQESNTWKQGANAIAVFSGYFWSFKNPSFYPWLKPWNTSSTR